MITLHLPDPAATDRLAARLAPLARAGDAVLLHGPLGAGKTAFVRAFLRALVGDATLEVPSPSFTLVQGYALPGGAMAHHFDLYRLAGPGDLTELGWEEAREGIVLVEWAERLGSHMPDDALTITLNYKPAANARCATLHGWADRGA